MKQNKFKYLRIIQQYIPDYGWCDVTAYDKNDREEMRDLRADLKAYREHEPYALRVIGRRMPATEQFHA